jgi:hypothetical protein
MSEFGNYWRDVKELGPIGSKEWMYSWASLRRGTIDAMIAASVEKDADLFMSNVFPSLSDDTLADFQSALAVKWSEGSAPVARGYAPLPPDEIDDPAWREIMQSEFQKMDFQQGEKEQ